MRKHTLAFWALFGSTGLLPGAAYIKIAKGRDLTQARDDIVNYLRSGDALKSLEYVLPIAIGYAGTNLAGGLATKTAAELYRRRRSKNTEPANLL